MRMPLLLFVGLAFCACVLLSGCGDAVPLTTKLAAALTQKYNYSLKERAPEIIVRQFFVETGLLVTLAFVCALPLLMHYVHESGMYHAIITGEPKDSLTVWWLETVPHFCMVSLLTYAILLLIALLGTYIPVSRAAKVLPADALRDE